jgi:uncharacterized protein YecE (DUF72 family)
MCALRVGMAGWDIPQASSDLFPGGGRDLERYAARFSVVEVNSTFYRRPHHKTLDRWREITPPTFRFAVRLPHELTHQGVLGGDETALVGFAADMGRLGDKAGPLIMQLPASLAFNPGAARFFGSLNQLTTGHLVCEPRHDTWFGPEADALLDGCHVARAVVGSSPHPSARRPGGWLKLIYRRLHGPNVGLDSFTAGAAETWCIFDNSVAGAAAASRSLSATAEAMLEAG